MIEQVAAALERKDYRTAAELLKQLLKESPQNPWEQFYLGRLHEVWQVVDSQKVYRQLLRGDQCQDYYSSTSGFAAAGSD